MQHASGSLDRAVARAILGTSNEGSELGMVPVEVERDFHKHLTDSIERVLSHIQASIGAVGAHGTRLRSRTAANRASNETTPFRSSLEA